ncbi:MAG: monovalent cation:proton antiporter-2 (CPA2) family protein [Pseudomonadota bacterium]
MDTFLFQATIYLAAACLAVPIAKRLGLGSVLGYLIAGIVIGPILGLVGSETQDLQHFAEFGVVMMLFIVGLELEPKSLWEMRAKLLGLGGMQIGVTAVAITGLFWFVGEPFSVALAIGLAFSLSSTAIVLQTLNEKNLMPTPGGRSSFSVLLAQDIAVIPMLAFIPLLVLPGLHNDAGHHGDGHGATMSLVDGLPGWGVTLVTIGAIAAVVLGGIYLTRPIFHYVASSRLREMFTAIALLLVVGIALLMTLVGLSPALGTFLAGVVLANSEFRHELESDIDPFKGLLLGLFFITVGAGINFDLLFNNLVEIIGLTLAVMLIKGAVLYALSIIFKIKGRNQWLFTLGLAQAGEFGFVMISTTVQNDVIPQALSEKLSLIVALSMLLTPLLFILYEQLTKSLDSGSEDHEEDDIDEQGNVIIVGMGRFGQIINRMALACGIKTVVIDHHIEQIERMRRFGTKAYFGDPTRPDLMHAAGLETCQVLVVAVDDRDAAVKLTEHARQQRPDLRIITRAYDREHVYKLWRAGSRDIVRETFDSAIRVSKYMLEGMGWNGFDIENATDVFVKADREALRELAELWDPNVDAMDNKAYIARAKEIQKDFNTGFLANLSKIVDADLEEEEVARAKET